LTDIFPYWNDPKKDQFDVEIETCIKSDDHYQITISDEVVRAAGGGQAGERGEILFGDSVLKFNDTARINGKLVLIANSPIDPGTNATIHIDMDWRRAMMRNHTGEHLFVAAIKKNHPEIELGYIWIDGNRGTVDLEGGGLGFDDLIEAELDVQQLIERDIPVKSKLVKASEVSSEVRAREGLTDKHEMMRIVSIGEHDSSACSGIHATNTCDIGFFKVIDFKKKDNAARVTFATGYKAKKTMAATFNEVLRRKHRYPFEMEQIGDVLDKAKSAAADQKLLKEKIVKLISEGITSEDIDGITLIHEYVPGLGSREIKSILKKITLSGPAVILLFIPSEKPTLTFSTNEMPLEAREYIAPIVEEMGGRGGGSHDIYTGGFSETIAPFEMYSEVLNSLRSRLCA
jgi:alanyl-tRNA synthetase